MTGMGESLKAQPVLRVGIIGCGEITQVAHIFTLNSLPEKFQITYLCDVSKQTLDYAKRRVSGPTPHITTRAEELTSSTDVDVVLVANANAFHVPHAILALENDKHVLVEKPLALCYADLNRLKEAEQKSKGKVFVGYMRRFAPAFLDMLAEVGSAKIQYVRVKDIIGQNAQFVAQSCTFPRKFSDYSTEDSEQLQSADNAMLEQMLKNEMGIEASDANKQMLNLLGGLGSHDLSAMRELIGMPKAVRGAYMGSPFWTAILEYEDFCVVYESGINSVPVFDAHIEIYTDKKIVRVNYDTPYIQGLPITMTIRENTEDHDGGGSTYQERQIRKTYEDPYTIEMLEWYECVVNGKEIKTTITDAKQDLDLFKMMMQSACKPGEAQSKRK